MEPAALSRMALDEFKSIYREEFNGEISEGEVEEMGMRLLRLFDMLARSSTPDSGNESVPRPL